MRGRPAINLHCFLTGTAGVSTYELPGLRRPTIPVKNDTGEKPQSESFLGHPGTRACSENRRPTYPNHMNPLGPLQRQALIWEKCLSARLLLAAALLRFLPFSPPFLFLSNLCAPALGGRGNSDSLSKCVKNLLGGSGATPLARGIS